LNVLEAVDTSDTVTNGEHFASLLQVDVALLTQDLVFEDFSDLGTSSVETG
jgi:hypothetical protein